MKINCQVRQASSNVDAKHYDTNRIRQEYLVQNLMVPDEINMVYSMFDRIIAGGAVPVKEDLLLSAPEVLRADFFTQRRELGIINVGGKGTVEVPDVHEAPCLQGAVDCPVMEQPAVPFVAIRLAETYDRLGALAGPGLTREFEIGVILPGGPSLPFREAQAGWDRVVSGQGQDRQDGQEHESFHGFAVIGLFRAVIRQY